jgi:hypothetical protein
MQKREPGGDARLGVSLVFLPYLGFLVFYFFGPRKVRRSESRRRGSYEAVRKAFARPMPEQERNRRTTCRCS